MTKPCPTRLTPRERLRWQRAMDEVLIDAIYGRVIRDTPLPVSAATLARLAGEAPVSGLSAR